MPRAQRNPPIRPLLADINADWPLAADTRQFAP